MKRQIKFPILRTAAGALFVGAGLLYYYGVTIGYSLAIVFVIAGVAVILHALAGHRARGGDLALFVIALIVLAGVTAGYPSARSSTVASYSGATSQFAGLKQIELSASADLGSINVQFSNSDSLVYQVTFTNSFFGFPVQYFAGTSYSLTNETRGGVLYLNVTSSSYSINVLLGKGYLTNISVSANTGSVNVVTPENSTLGTVVISDDTGSVDASISAQKIASLRVRVDTRSVNLRSSYLAPGGPKVPISVSADTGSVNVNSIFPGTTAVSLNATNSFGSISHNLPGFTISQNSNSLLRADAGDITTANQSFVVSISTSTGSINVDAKIDG